MQIRIRVAQSNDTLVILWVIIGRLGQFVILQCGKSVDNVRAQLGVNVLWLELAGTGSLGRPAGQITEDLGRTS